MRISRVQEVPWKLRWEDVGKDRVAFLGRHQIGRVVTVKGSHRRRVLEYIGYLSLPGMYGPVVHEASLLLACSSLRGKVQEWLAGMDEGIPDTTTKSRVRR